jgi:DNA-binding FadR family transcriptional regulator
MPPKTPHRAIRLRPRGRDQASVPLPQHGAIAEAVIAPDPLAAERAMPGHLGSVLKAGQALAVGSAR